MPATLDRRSFLTAACAAAASLALPGLLRSAAPGKRPPNIVYIMADDLGLRHLGCYGGDKIDTPNIDRLAAEGIRFTETYAGCTVCAPSRSVLMTGLHTGHTPVRGNNGGQPLRDGDITVAEVLRAAGYATGGFGKWGLGEVATTGVPEKQGFDTFAGYYHQIHAHFYYPEYIWKNGYKWPLPGNQVNGRYPGDGMGQRTQYVPDVLNEMAINFIQSNADIPFFCYISTIIPHVELAVPDADLVAKYHERFGPEEPFHDPRPGYMGSPTPRATYAAMVEHMDRNVGKVMDELRRLGLDDNTIVFFTSDNGAQGTFGQEKPGFFEWFEPMKSYRASKGSMYEGGLRVPMIARWPGKITPGTVNDSLAWYFADILPTFAALANAEPPDGLDGMSVLPALIGEKAAGARQREHEYLYWEMQGENGPRQALRMGEWKAVREASGGKLELFNLAADPGESRDVSALSPDVMARIGKLLDTCRTEPRPQIGPVDVQGQRYY
jgi:arylsulfatase A-like enzyme